MDLTNGQILDMKKIEMIDLKNKIESPKIVK
jgi:hypothetical protein